MLPWVIMTPFGLDVEPLMFPWVIMTTFGSDVEPEV
jgi:hypothetical protein